MTPARLRKNSFQFMLALSLALMPSLSAQEPTGDAFLDAMLEAEKASAQDIKEKATPLAEAKDAQSLQDARQKTIQKARQHDPRAAHVSDAERELSGDSGIFSQESVYEGRPVSKVEINYTTGKRTVPDARLLDLIATRAGMSYKATRINTDLERLIKSGLVAPDTLLVVEPSGDSVKIIFEVKSSNVLAGVGFRGASRFDENELREASKLKSGHVINDGDLAKARAALSKHYYEAGYPDAKIEWKEIPTSRPAYRDMQFSIDEGAKVEMYDIEFSGNHQFDSEQLRQLMKTKEKGLFYFLTKSGRVNRVQLKDDLDELVKHYRNFGYLRARIADVSYGNKGDAAHHELRMLITIDEGPRYRVRNVSFGNLKAYTPAELKPGLSMLDGDIYSLKKVSDDTTMIRRYYGAKGYADASVAPDISEVGKDAQGMRLIDIHYNVDEGQTYRVGRINVRGNSTTRSYVLLRELPLKSGDMLNAVDLETARKRLNSLGYFADTQVSQSPSNSSGYRDVNINVVEKRTGTLTLGVAFSSIENVYVYATVTQSNFDISGFSTGQFTGGGQRLTISGKLGADTQNASIYLLEPWFLDRKIAYGNELFFSSSDYMSDYYMQENFGYATSLRYATGDLSAVKFEYRIEKFGIESNYDSPLYFEKADGNYTRSHIELSYDYDSRDAMITPRSGGKLEAILGYSGPGSSVQTYNVGLNGSYYINSFWDTILSFNFGAETVKAVDSDEEVPIFERAYLGGPNNLRGFRYRDVGMINEAIAGDETMGGNSAFFVQVEYTVPIFETMRMAFFVDAGFVNEDSFDFIADGWAADYGIGLRINLPMGPLAVDYAIPFKSENAIDDGGQFQFYVDYKY